jgi:hypothetical protein
VRYSVACVYCVSECACAFQFLIKVLFSGLYFILLYMCSGDVVTSRTTPIHHEHEGGEDTNQVQSSKVNAIGFEIDEDGLMEEEEEDSIYNPTYDAAAATPKNLDDKPPVQDDARHNGLEYLKQHKHHGGDNNNNNNNHHQDHHADHSLKLNADEFKDEENDHQNVSSISDNNDLSSTDMHHAHSVPPPPPPPPPAPKETTPSLQAPPPSSSTSTTTAAPSPAPATTATTPQQQVHHDVLVARAVAIAVSQARKEMTAQVAAAREEEGMEAAAAIQALEEACREKDKKIEELMELEHVVTELRGSLEYAETQLSLAQQAQARTHAEAIEHQKEAVEAAMAGQRELQEVLDHVIIQYIKKNIINK